MKYDIEHFIKKVENTPEEKIITNAFDDGMGGHCINGLCGVRFSAAIFTEESLALKELFSCLQVHRVSDGVSYLVEDLPNYSLIAAMINNGSTIEYQQPTAWQRLLAAMNDIRVHQIITAALAKQETEENLQPA